MLFGILGLGSIGNRHAKNLMALGHQVLTYDPAFDPTQISTREQVIEQADAVVICSPTEQHAPDLRDVLIARKHVLVEKPIGYDCPPYIAGLITGARSAKPDLVVAVGFMCRFHPQVILAKQLMDKGWFGEIVGANFTVAQLSTKDPYLRDGVIRNWASHEIDIARHLLGNLEVTSCQAGNIGTTSGVTLTPGTQENCALIEALAIDHDADITIHADYLAEPESRHFSIFGSDRSKKFDLTQDNWDQTYIDEMKAFINRIDGKYAFPLADGADGVAALEIVMQAREKAGLND